jgi:hypothetical protein
MTIPMPRQLRVYDHLEDQYRIWAIVRYMRPSVSDDRTVFDVGVAFIGKRPPASYKEEPWRRYDIATNTFQGETNPDDLLTPFADQRAYTRHSIPVDMRVEVIDVNGQLTNSEQTVTEEISTRGATLFTTLQIPKGRFIRVISEQYGITALAAIRSRSTGADGVPRIHVEFIDREWPL